MTDLIPAELLEKGAAYIEEHGLHQGDFWQGAGGFVTLGEMQRAVAAGLPACASGALTIARGVPRGFQERVEEFDAALTEAALQGQPSERVLGTGSAS